MTYIYRFLEEVAHIYYYIKNVTEIKIFLLFSNQNKNERERRERLGVS